MAQHKELNIAAVKGIFSYDAEIGLINKNPKRGKKAVYILPNGYAYGYVLDRLIPVQRLVWALHHGDPGELDIDHIDRNKLNNKIENLRAVTRSENNQNQVAPQSNNKTSGVRGVHYDKSRELWAASLNLNGRKVFFERYATKEEAVAGRLWAEKTYFTHKT